jgi:penicillin-binding protein 1A
MNLLKRILKTVFGSVFLATVTLVGAPVAFGATVLAGLVFLPLPASIPVPKTVATVQPTVIYDRYGHPIAELSQYQRDLPFTEAQVPAIVKEAVISDEDRNFYHESGIDVRGMVRALAADLRNKSTVQGGSTITQQYVKLAYLNSERTVVRKVKEAILASQLARQASKDDILYHYLTLIYLGDGNTGVEAASESYFHLPIQDLNPSQAATLAGLIPAPSARAPEEHLALAETYRELVLKKMYQQGYIGDREYRFFLARHLAMAGTPGATPATNTIVYPEVYTTINDQFPDFVNYVQAWLTKNIPASVLEQGGLRIQTTMDPAVENDARAVVAATLDGSAMPVDMAMAAVEPTTGFVSAIVGGRYFSSPLAGKYQYDNFALGGCQDPRAMKGVVIYAAASCWNGSMITGGGGGRQPGSSFKPFTLATAFLDHIPPSTVYESPYVYQIPNCANANPSACQIHNDEGDIGGATQETLAQATAQSTNTVYAQVAEQVTCPSVANTAKALGIESAYYSTPPFYYCASYALGEVGVSPLDMASAYGVFAAHGEKATPTPILEIVNAQGKVLVDNIHHVPTGPQILPANVADNVTNVLQGVLTSGTGTAAQIGRPAAGKTGTTTNNTDAWFVGYTPTLSTAVWMGNADSDSTPVGYSANCPHGCVTGHYLNGPATTFDGLYGGEWPAISWKEFMQLALANVPVTPFSAPAPILTPPEAAALQAPQTTTTVVVTPGASGAVDSVPDGGPYVYPVTPPVASPPTVATTTTTSVPPTTTTNPSGSTTTPKANGTG